MNTTKEKGDNNSIFLFSNLEWLKCCIWESKIWCVRKWESREKVCVCACVCACFFFMITHLLQSFFFCGSYKLSIFDLWLIKRIDRLLYNKFDALLPNDEQLNHFLQINLRRKWCLTKKIFHEICQSPFQSGSSSTPPRKK